MKKQAKKQFTFIDLFAGCGGLSLGMEQAGFTPVFANEIWVDAAETYRRNRNLDEKQVFVGDIKYLVDHLQDFPIPKNVTMVCGGPPCQGFSMANRQRVIDDPRNHRVVLNAKGMECSAASVPSMYSMVTNMV